MARVRADIEITPADEIAIKDRIYGPGCIITMGQVVTLMLTPEAEAQLCHLLNVRMASSPNVLKFRGGLKPFRRADELVTPIVAALDHVEKVPFPPVNGARPTTPGER